MYIFTIDIYNKIFIKCVGNNSNKTKNKYRIMKKTNNKFAAALCIMSLLSVAAIYFEFAATVVMVIALGFSAFISFVAMMCVYHYNGYDFNVGQYWFAYSAVCGVIINAAIFAHGTHIMGEHVAISIILGLIPSILPIIGIFIGDVGRILIKAEPSAI